VKAIRRVTVDDAGLGRWTEPWDGLVRERADGDDGFVAIEGPFRSYHRTVEVVPAGDGRHEVISTVDFGLAIPYFNFLLVLPMRHALRNPGAPLPWWGPADRLDARASAMLGVLCMASLVAGYVGTSLTQTITYASDDFHLSGDRPQSIALAATRLCAFIAVGIVAFADRRGRRKLLLLSAVGALLLGATTAFAPSLFWYTLSQTLTRGCSTAMAVLITVVAAEEMPKGARAFGVSVLGMSGALGAGICVLALPLADTGEGGWRWLFLLPLVALPLLRHVAGRLPESRRFEADHAIPDSIGHHDRLWLLGVSVFLLQLFTAPASQLQNEFLRDERAYSAIAITLFSVCTATPAGIGVVAGGRLADVHGRRIVGAIGLVGGIAGTVVMFLTRGPAMWLWSLGASVVGGATLPALGVYGPELFPTGVRARANGVLVIASVIGSASGLIAAGWLSDTIGGLGRALAVLAIGPAVLTVLVVLRYPETARKELEELNPEDAGVLT
jgi:MFS family permease